MSKVNVRELGVAVALAMVIGGAVGLGIGVLGRHFGLGTLLVAPVTGAVVGALVPTIYRLRAGPPAGGSS
jgi:hypothetical protein